MSTKIKKTKKGGDQDMDENLYVESTQSESDTEVVTFIEKNKSFKHQFKTGTFRKLKLNEEYLHSTVPEIIGSIFSKCILREVMTYVDWIFPTKSFRDGNEIKLWKAQVTVNELTRTIYFKRENVLNKIPVGKIFSNFDIIPPQFKNTGPDKIGNIKINVVTDVKFSDIWSILMFREIPTCLYK